MQMRCLVEILLLDLNRSGHEDFNLLKFNILLFNDNI
jgi:hypothetical protein